jgi:hypothetical protein
MFTQDEIIALFKSSGVARWLAYLDVGDERWVMFVSHVTSNTLCLREGELSLERIMSHTIASDRAFAEQAGLLVGREVVNLTAEEARLAEESMRIWREEDR